MEHREHDWRSPPYDHALGVKIGQGCTALMDEEVFNGETVWDGIVEVFHLAGHPKNDTVYAWMHNTGDPEKSFRHVAVLRIHSALSH